MHYKAGFIITNIQRAAENVSKKIEFVFSHDKNNLKHEYFDFSGTYLLVTLCTSTSQPLRAVAYQMQR